MPEGIPYASSNVIAGVGKDLNYVGEYCFAYSGAVQDAASSAASTVCLDFVTGNETIRGKLQFETDAFVSQVFYLDVQFNGISIFHAIWDHSPDKTLMQSPLRLIIPPYTNVKVLWGLTNDTKNGYATFTGKLHK
jgi:hypothetical protein